MTRSKRILIKVSGKLAMLNSTHSPNRIGSLSMMKGAVPVVSVAALLNTRGSWILRNDKASACGGGIEDEANAGIPAN